MFKFAAAVPAFVVLVAGQTDCGEETCGAADATVYLQTRASMAEEDTAPGWGSSSDNSVGVGASFPFDSLQSIVNAIQSANSTGTCLGPVTAEESVVKSVIGSKYTKGSKCLGWWNTPSPSMDTLKKLQAKLTDYAKPTASLIDSRAAESERWGWRKSASSEPKMMQGSAEEVARAMYEANFIPGHSDKGPSSLRGVWWMRGNAMPEELFSNLQGTWVEEANSLIVPDGPFSWAWPTECFPAMPLGGAVCTKDRAWTLSMATVGTPQAISFNWNKCPAKKFAYNCKETVGDLSYGLMQLHKPYGRLDKTASGIKLAGVQLSSTFTMEAPKSPAGGDGNEYFRGCYWGLNGCNPIQMGSYDLVKLIDIDGKTVEPYWSEWLKYAGSVNMFTFAGWGSNSERDSAKRAFESRC